MAGFAPLIFRPRRQVFVGGVAEVAAEAPREAQLGRGALALGVLSEADRSSSQGAVCVTKVCHGARSNGGRRRARVVLVAVVCE
eukprot:3086706-Alexandrium_andersonii.AAC.1